MERAKLKIAAMDNTELENMAVQFAAGQVELTHEEALAGMARIPEQRETFKEGIQDRLLDKPWISESEENQTLYEQQQRDINTPPGTVVIDGTSIHVEHLVDYDNELEQE